MSRDAMAHMTGSSKLREWVEARLPWYSPHTERLRNVKSEIISRVATDTTEEAQRVIDRQRLIDDYESADEAAHVQHKRLIDEARRDDDQ